MKVEEFDSIIIGTGQGGSPLASFLASKSERVAVVERGFVGGTCVNSGCTPTKTLISTARVAHLNETSSDFGINHGLSSVDFKAVQERKTKVVLKSRTGSEKRLKEDSNITFISGTASFSGPKEIQVQENGVPNTRKLTARHIFLDTGTSSSIPKIPGLSESGFLTSESLLDIREIPNRLIIAGGSYIALEYGQMFSRFGSEVTLLQRDKSVLPREDPDISEEIQSILSNEGIEVLTGIEIISVENIDPANQDPKTIMVNIKLPGGELRSIEGSHLFIATGREPNTADLKLENAGIKVNEKGYIEVNEYLETNVPGVFALGDVKGGPAFTHISYDDYRIVRHNLYNPNKKSIRNRVVPYTVFLDPELGRTGLTEKEAKEKGIKYKVAKIPVTSVARAIEAGETLGFWKVLVDEDTDLILGASILSIGGGEISSFLHLAILAGISYKLIRDSPFSHPTLTESLNNLLAKVPD